MEVSWPQSIGNCPQTLPSKVLMDAFAARPVAELEESVAVFI
jgi:hypothetical protein